jgi:SAM-dependent methyltransferase
MGKLRYSDFNQLAEATLAYRGSKALLVALHFDLFSWLERGYDTPRSLSLKLSLDSEALRTLLNAISALGYLRRRGERYENAPLARKFLVAHSPLYKGNNLKYQEQTWDAWSDLRHVVKTGKPRRSLQQWLRKETFTQDYIKAMHDISREPARELAGKLDWRGVERFMDVGSGPGAYSAAFVERSPKTEGTLFDLPDSLQIARTFLKRHPRRDRFVFRPGNYHQDGFGRDDFDLILLSHVTHNENPATNLKLLRNAHRALRPRGKVVIHDFVLDPAGGAPKFSALFALHMLVFTGVGNVYTLKEYSGWMRQAGFKNIRRIPIAQGSINASVALVGQAA